MPRFARCPLRTMPDTITVRWMWGGDRAIRAVCHLKSTVSAVEKPRNARVKDMLRVTLSTQHPPCSSWHLALQRTESSQAVSFLRLHGYKSVASAVPLRHKAGFSDWKLRHSIPRPWEKWGWKWARHTPPPSQLLVAGRLAATALEHPRRLQWARPSLSSIELLGRERWLSGWDQDPGWSPSIHMWLKSICDSSLGDLLAPTDSACMW